MRIIICGAGQVGFNIARQLARENNDVTVVDTSPELIRRVSDRLDAQGIVGHASRPDILDRAGAGESDMLIAVTHTDEVNMVACQVAHSLFQVPVKIARIREQSYLDPAWSGLFTRANLPIDVIISPEVEVARAVTHRLRVPGSFEMLPLADDKVRLLGVHCGAECPLLNTPIKQLTQLFPDLNAQIVSIVRGDKPLHFSGDDQLACGDDVYFVVETEVVGRAMAAFGHEEDPARRLLICGGGTIALLLAQEIERDLPSITVKIIELKPERAAQVASVLTNTVVLVGDVLAPDILEEAGVASADTVVSLTDDDETNILSSILAKRHGAGRVITLLNKETYDSIVTPLGIDVVVSPRNLTASTILQHVRRGRIHAVHALRDGVGEVIEAEALETSNLVGQPLKDIQLPSGVMVGAIVRGGKVIIPRGTTVIQHRDRVILFAASDAVRRVEKLFSVRLEYF
ncbi:MAG: Trk system potassium transporter TrkA [Defluviicoccus sp.]|nr:Trk system potassium transporter TrkA [Defluviicoccus sp.]MDG4592432.1 Trk system potassium transporter TrkA [Defluviicoccus sp.]MDS4010480.1 Trk system potassium transporter TrkA [Defluviicoccus sp.]MDS4071791.1 Trk system potassium transporter TrkA [Defluviicoccus sp.]